MPLGRRHRFAPEIPYPYIEEPAPSGIAEADSPLLVAFFVGGISRRLGKAIMNDFSAISFCFYASA
jgi:hypothetical protein